MVDSFYLLNSLWSLFSAPQVCSSNSYVVSGVASESKILAPVTAFVDVNVVPMDREQVLPNQTVLIQNGRILALGSAIEVPVGAVRVEGRGKYLMPGLADMHAHLSSHDVERRLFSYLAQGVTTVRNLNAVHSHMLKDFKTVVVSPHLYIAPPIMGGDPTSMQLTDVAAHITRNKAVGYNFLSISADYVRLPLGERTFFDSLLVAAHRLGVPVASHSHTASLDETLAFGAHGGSVEHLYAFQALLGRPEADVSMSEIQAVAAATQRAGLWITLTLDCTEYNQKPPGSSLKLARKLVKALQDAGAGLLLGSDANGGVGWSASIIHTELAALVRAGLTPYQALRTGTRNVAQYLEQLDSSGTVAVGKRADLVLLNGNPLSDIRYTREPAGVMVSGRWFDRAALDQGLLASLKSWYQDEVWGGIMPGVTGKQEKKRKWERYKKFEILADSLTVAKVSGRDGEGTSHRLRQQLADELGAMRTGLTPEQLEMFDPQARVWLRQQARQGYLVVIPGVVASP